MGINLGAKKEENRLKIDERDGEAILEVKEITKGQRWIGEALKQVLE